MKPAPSSLKGGNFVIANSSSANAYLVVWQGDGNVGARPFSATPCR